jgi:hypothetical protein
MKRAPLSLLFTASALALASWFATPVAAQVTTLNDITTWIGTGNNRAALVIDFDDIDATSPALVWGYRFDGAVSAEAMFRAITLSDTQLYAKLTEYAGFGWAVSGMGYDIDDDGFGVSDMTTFDAGGLAEVAGPTDGILPTDADDVYREGFFTDGFWNMSVAASSPYDGGAWETAMLGLTDTILSDGMFVGFTFDSDFSFGPQDFPQNPQNLGPVGGVAVPEPSSLWVLAMVMAVGLGCHRCYRLSEEG